jgi:hypothetical protein
MTASPDSEAALQLTIRHNGHELYHDIVQAPFEMGRHDPEENEPAPFALIGNREFPKLVIAETSTMEISRRHLRIEAIPGRQRFRVTNIGKNSFWLQLRKIDAGKELELALPFLIELHPYQVNCESLRANAETDERLETITPSFRGDVPQAALAEVLSGTSFFNEQKHP